MRFLILLLFFVFPLNAHKVYQSADELPKSHRMIWSVKQRALPNPNYNFYHDQIGRNILQTWEPDQLPPNTHMVHGLEPAIFDSVVNYYRDCPEDISNKEFVMYYLDFFFTYKQVIAASLIQLSDNPFKAQQVTYTACGFILDVPPPCI